MAAITNEDDNFVYYSVGNDPASAIQGKVDKKINPMVAEKVKTGAPGIDAFLTTKAPGISFTLPSVSGATLPMADATQVGVADPTGMPEPAAAAATSKPTSTMPGKMELKDTETQIKSMAPEAAKALDKQVDLGMKYADAKATLDKKQDDIALERAQRIQDQRKYWQEREALNQTFQQAELDQYMSDTEKSYNELSQARVDDKNYWGKLGTGNQVMAAIGLALGAVGQAVTGKDSQALGILKASVERDIDAQKANIAKLGKQAEISRGRLQDFMAVSKDNLAAEQLAKASAFEVAENEITALMKTLPDGQQKANLLKLQEGVQATKAEALQKATGRMTTIKKSEQMAKPLDAVAEGETKKLAEDSSKLERLYEVKNFFKDITTGPLAGRVQNLAMKVGVDHPEYAAARTALEGQYQRYKLMITGTASSAKQDKELQNLYPNMFDTDANFMAKLDEVIKENESIYDAKLKAFENQRKNHGQRSLDDLQRNAPRSYESIFTRTGK
jgi:hypothetical protein